MYTPLHFNSAGFPNTRKISHTRPCMLKGCMTLQSVQISSQLMCFVHAMEASCLNPNHPDRFSWYVKAPPVRFLKYAATTSCHILPYTFV